MQSVNGKSQRDQGIATHINEVDERVSDAVVISVKSSRAEQYRWCNSLAIVGKIDAQVHEVVLAPAALVDDALQHGLINLVWNVPQHDLDDVSKLKALGNLCLYLLWCGHQCRPGCG